MKVRCPAKINLYLRILGKRPDGFHELETLMCPVSLFDEMELERADGGVELRVEGADIPAGDDNLVVRAARLLQEFSGKSHGARIFLRKAIPVGGGLAGGSSNAALALLALNRLWDCGLPMEKLEQAAASMGSDINFFLYRKPAICRGRGEQVEPVELSRPLAGLLVNPGFGVPTPWAYKTYAANPRKGELGRLLLQSRAGKGAAWQEFRLQNDLEPAVFDKYLWIREAGRWLARQNDVLDSMMSGSGATVFALLENKVQAECVAAKARDYFGARTWIQPVDLLTKGWNYEFLSD
ncbi:MAG: 4-(cytidine 5'-diphospho)-2-C-methyl-D-erythritol kinase [Methylacidiphilales bacterium]|nr:4-(cytidine 5'-diphospho)-2-C-methyl-D-erythritol kinase [Candidatus Methylacidiphilales bacterium]